MKFLIKKLWGAIRPNHLLVTGFVVLPCVVFAAEVQVREYTIVGNTTNLLTTANKVTGVHYSTQTAPNVNNYIFTHWTCSSGGDLA